jgi:PAS domain S-box-containing protein
MAIRDCAATLSNRDPVLDAALDAVITIDSSGEIIEFNSAAERMFGFLRSDVLGRRVGDLLVPDPQRPAHEAGLQRVAAGGETQIIGRRVRLSAQRSDGREIIVELFVSRTSEAPLRFTAWIRELSVAEAERTTNDDQWHVVAADDEPAPAGSWTWIPSQDELRWSDNLYRIFGLHPGEIAPGLKVIFDIIHPDDRGFAHARVQDRTTGAEVPPTPWRIIRPDGQVRHLRTVVAVAERRGGAPYRLVGFVEDLTERMRARRGLAALRATTQAIAAWTSFEQGAQLLLAGLGEALECQRGVVWLPLAQSLVARTVWDDGTTDATRVDPVARGARLRRTSEPAWRARARREAVRAPFAVAIPAVLDEEEGEVLAVVELRSLERLELSARLMRSLAEVGSELGRFLAERRDELDVPLLTPRELEVLALATRGLPAKEIAEHLAISNATVRTHFENIYPKLRVSDRAAAVAAAIRLGLIG